VPWRLFALAWFAAVTAGPPLAAQGDADSALQLLRSRKYEAAASAFERVLQDDPGDARACDGLAKIDLEYSHDYDRAERYAKRAVASDPTVAMYHAHLAGILGVKALYRGMISAIRLAPRARASAEKALALDPGCYPARQFLLQYYLAAPAIVGGGAGRARRLVSETLARDRPQGLRLQATLDNFERRPAQAEQALLQAIALGPSDTAAYNALGYLHLAARRHEQALAAFRTCIELDPGDPNSYDSYGDGLWAAGEYGQAAEQYRKALAINPRFTDAVYKLAKAYDQSGQRELAIGQYRACREIDPESPYARRSGQRIIELGKR
jgi:tetratricopeptide (TPR) repeat protein